MPSLCCVAEILNIRVRFTTCILPIWDNMSLGHRLVLLRSMQQHGDKRRGMRARLTTAATRQRPRWTADAAVALLYAASALAFTYPLWLDPGNHIAYKASGDQLWVLSLLEWMRTALFSRPDEFFAGNFYFGSGGAMFGSDLMLGYLPIYGPLAWVTQNPVLAYSLTHIAAYALNAGAMYAAVLVLTRSRPGALLAGAIYAFGPLQLAYSNHFQFLGAWWAATGSAVRRPGLARRRLAGLWAGDVDGLGSVRNKRASWADGRHGLRGVRGAAGRLPGSRAAEMFG